MAWDLPSRVTMMISVPGESGARITNSYTELVDLMPTLTDLAMGLKLQACPKKARAARARSLCTDGKSLRPLFLNPRRKLKEFAVTQTRRKYPKWFTTESGERVRSVCPRSQVRNGSSPTQRKQMPCLYECCSMGYSLVATVQNAEHRYTAWTRYTALGGPDWGYVLGRELYNHKEDPGENVNIVQSRAPKVANVRSQMHEWLEAHTISSSAATMVL
eukprot:jgi/Bigna1/87015/estExt_fgenesh1_pg.C_160028